MTHLTNLQLNKLENFIGYGKPNAEIIFMGLEEAGGGYENIMTRINTPDYRYLDCKRFHLDNLVIEDKKTEKYKLHNDHDSKSVIFQPVWKFMSYLMLRLEGKSKDQIFQNNKQLLRDYQNNFLGTKNIKGNTLLTEIYPIPCSGYNI